MNKDRVEWNEEYNFKMERGMGMGYGNAMIQS